MNPDRELVQRHFAALCIEARTSGASLELIGRLLLDEIIATWRETRSLEEIGRELDFLRANLDPDQEFVFMRP